jgi:hypothetical protein
MTNQVERAERIAAARQKLQRVMGRMVVAEVTDHPPTSASLEAKGRLLKEDASGARGDRQPEAARAGEVVGTETEGRGTSTGQSRPAGQ